MIQFETASRHICERVVAARADGVSLRIRGAGSKDFYVPQRSGEVLTTTPLNGVHSYEPSELVVVAGAGTPLAELESMLAEQGQHLAFEPPHFGRPATVGGMVACALAGPARASAGGVRDYVLGLRLINGLGQHLTFGGQVMKNVAGYDVSRLMAGSLGTLGVITQVSLKVLPMAPAQASLQFALEQAPALAQLHRWGGQPLPLNASCWRVEAQAGAQLYVRLRGARAAVDAACQQMLSQVPGQRLESAAAAAFWDACRNHSLDFFAQPPDPNLQLWRLSVPQVAPAVDLPGAVLIEWHGALRWLWAPAQVANALQETAQRLGGSAQLFAPGDGVPNHAVARPRLLGSSAARNAIAARLKTSFDPHGLFNPDLSPHANQSGA